MIFSVDLNNSKPAYLQIADSVRQAIARGVLQCGDRLPTIRETAVQTRVNRNTVSRAYLELEHQGLVKARQGSGVYITDGGNEQNQIARQQALVTKIEELLTESRLSNLSTDDLLSLVKDEAEKLQALQTATGTADGGRRRSTQ